MQGGEVCKSMAQQKVDVHRNMYHKGNRYGHDEGEGVLRGVCSCEQQYSD